jgi:hypothetical protein
MFGVGSTTALCSGNSANCDQHLRQVMQQKVSSTHETRLETDGRDFKTWRGAPVTVSPFNGEAVCYSGFSTGLTQLKPLP